LLQAKKISKETGIDIGFKDVAGCDEAKLEVGAFPRVVIDSTFDDYSSNAY